MSTLISRRATISLAEIYYVIFEGSQRVGPSGYNRRYTYRLKIDSLYDFLYMNDYDAWFLNSAKNLRVSNPRAIKEFIMQLHTGEIVVEGTPDWTWQQREMLGQRLLQNLAEDIITYCKNPDKYKSSESQKHIEKLISELELDGYIYKDGQLYFSEAAVLETEAEEGILSKLVSDLSLANQDIIDYHLQLSEQHYIEGSWSDSISNSRKYFEAVLQEIAARFQEYKFDDQLSKDIFSKPLQVRNYLEAQGLIEPKEKEAISKIYGLLSETGGHPYIAEKDQARLMRHLALTFCQFALLRLQGAMKGQ